MLTLQRPSLSRALLLRVARQLQERVVAAARQPAPATFPDAGWEELQKLRRQTHKALQHELAAAAAELQRQQQRTVQRLLRELDAWCTARESADTRLTRCNSVDEIYRDLLNLEAEFDEVRIERREQRLTVRTESIALDGIDFGAFDIVLNWGDIGDGTPYEVVAVTPLRCAADESVTHPHVQSDMLCAGDGKVPIDRALARGDLFGFFVIVRQVLQTYNESSAYKSLDEWFGADCPRCGGSLHEDNSGECELCHADICADCYDCCTTCGDYVCHDCSDLCQDCEEPVCQHCSQSADPDDGRLCKECAETRAEQETETTLTQEEPDAHANETTETPAESGTGTAVYARCLVETPLPA